MPASNVFERGLKRIISYEFERVDDVVDLTAIGGPVVDKDQLKEYFAFMSQVPKMTRDGAGGNERNELTDYKFGAETFGYTAELAVPKKMARRDKSGYVKKRIMQLPNASPDNWMQLMVDRLVGADNASNGIGYDKKPLFSDTHPIPYGGKKDPKTQSNIHAATAVAPTDPTVEEMAKAIRGGISLLRKMRGDTGYTMNTAANQFMIYSGTDLANQIDDSMNMKWVTNGSGNTVDNVLLNKRRQLGLIDHPYFDGDWTNKFAIVRADQHSSMHPLIRLEENKEIDSLTEGSDHAYKKKEHLYRIEADRSVIFGMYQGIVLVTLNTP